MKSLSCSHKRVWMNILIRHHQLFVISSPPNRIWMLHHGIYLRYIHLRYIHLTTVYILFLNQKKKHVAVRSHAIERPKRQTLYTIVQIPLWDSVKKDWASVTAQGTGRPLWTALRLVWKHHIIVAPFHLATWSHEYHWAFLISCAAR